MLIKCMKRPRVYNVYTLVKNLNDAKLYGCETNVTLDYVKLR